jgi:hypothetical protein
MGTKKYPKRKKSVTRKMVDEETRLRKQGTLTGRAASGFVGAGAGFVGAWEPLKHQTGVVVSKQSPAYKIGWVAGHAAPVPMAHAARGLKIAKAAMTTKKYSKGATTLVKAGTKTAGGTLSKIKRGSGTVLRKTGITKVVRVSDRLPLWRASESIAGTKFVKQGKFNRKGIMTQGEIILARAVMVQKLAPPINRLPIVRPIKPKSLRSIRRDATRAQNRRAIKILKQADIARAKIDIIKYKRLKKALDQQDRIRKKVSFEDLGVR